MLDWSFLRDSVCSPDDDAEAQAIAILANCHYSVKGTLKFYKAPPG
jgi:hypothetical protein